MSMFQEHKYYHKLKWNIILFCSLLIFLSIIYIQFFSKDFSIKPFGLEVLIVKSNSMNPIIYKDDIVVIKKQDEYEIGDIISYKDVQGNTITHRIIEKNEDVYCTKGDNNNTKDDIPIHIENIQGKVISILYSSKGQAKR